jgi:uncharacterized protein YbjT (DUF2867 family)
VVFFGSR